MPETFSGQALNNEPSLSLAQIIFSFVAYFKQIRAACAWLRRLLDGRRRQHYVAVVPVAPSLYRLEIVRLGRRDVAQTGAAAAYVHYNTRQLTPRPSLEALWTDTPRVRFGG